MHLGEFMNALTIVKFVNGIVQEIVILFLIF